MRNLVVTFALLLVLGGTHLALANTSEPQALSPQQSLEVDAQSYARDFNVTLEEAIRRLELQQATAEAYPKLTAVAGEAFGGVWLQHQPDYRWVIQLTDLSLAQAVSEAIDHEGLRDIIEIRPVDLSLQELLDTHVNLAYQLNQLDTPTNSGSNIQAQQIEIYTMDLEGLQRELDIKGIELPTNAVFIEKEHLAIPEAGMGGLSVDRNSWGGQECTTGFSVWYQGQKRMTAAAHCDNSVFYNGSALGYVNQWHYGAYDIQILSAPSGWVVENRVKDVWPYYSRTIIAQISKWGTIGHYVCKYGAVTGKTCGNVAQVDYNQYQSSPSYVLVISYMNQQLSCGGDSGSPWFSGNSAYGMHVAGWCGTQAVYMSVNSMWNLGVNVMTSP